MRDKILSQVFISRERKVERTNIKRFIAIKLKLKSCGKIAERPSQEAAAAT